MGTNKKYKASDEIVIFYNPQKPSQSVIERKPQFIVLLVFVGIVITLGAFLFFCAIENIDLL